MRISPFLSRTEALRLKADYTGTEIDANAATEVILRAETFVRTVERVFGLEGSSKMASVETGNLADSPAVASQARPLSLEEMRRKGREDWLAMQEGRESTPEQNKRIERIERIEPADEKKKDIDQNHGPDDDLGL